MKKDFFTVEKNEQLVPGVFLMQLSGDTSAVTNCGQFINIALSGFYLRRPISVCDLENGLVTIIYKTVGEGTAYMATLPRGSSLDVMTGLGNGFDTAKSGEAPLLIGGGVGSPPMYLLAKTLAAQGKKPTVILGFNTAAEAFFVEEFEKICKTIVTTVDGSRGIKGFVTAAMEQLCGEYTFTYACGPEPMLQAVYNQSCTDGQFSFEERMGCGFGACMGCTCKTKYGSKRICKDGPVLDKEEIVW